MPSLTRICGTRGPDLDAGCLLREAVLSARTIADPIIETSPCRAIGELRLNAL